MRIYALKEIESSEIRYIGLTKGSLTGRFIRHLNDKKVDHKTNWIKKVGRDSIEIVLIEDNIDVIKIRELFDSGKFTKKQLSDMFNVKPPAIYKIVKKLTWNHI